jgi:hypothetical protein
MDDKLKEATSSSFSLAGMLKKTTHVDSIRSLEVDQMSGLLGSGLIEDGGQKSKERASESALFR